MFKKVEERIPIKDLIIAQIEEAILTKQLLPGEKLPSENELCVQFAASRTSVREAIQALAAQGLVSVEKGKGIFVNKINSESVVNPLSKYLQLKLDSESTIDLVKARQIFEPAIAYEAALKHTDKDLEILETDILELEKSKGGYEELANLDMNFHQHLAQSTQNVVVPLVLKPIQQLIPELKSQVYATVSEAKESAIIWHRKILDSIKLREPQSAYDRMTEHLKIAEEHARQVLSNKNNLIKK